MKFNYSGRNLRGEKVSGLLDSFDKKSAIIELKKRKIIVTKIKEKKELGKIKHIARRSKDEFNAYKDRIISSTKRIVAIEKIHSYKKRNKNNKKYNIRDINEILKDTELFQNIKDELKEDIKGEVKNEVKDIDVDAIMLTDFKNIEEEYIKESKPPLTNLSLDIETVKKLLNTDISSTKKIKKGIRGNKSKKVNSRELMMFCKKISTLLKTGVSLTKSLQILISQVDNEYFKKVIAVVAKNVSQGTTLSESMAKFPNVFDSHFTALVKTGEDTGELSKTFELLHKEILDNEKTKAKVIGASIYPVVILGVLLIAFIFTAIKLVPMYEDLFEGMGLPAFTKVVFNFLRFFKSNLHWIMISTFLTITIFSFSLKNLYVRYKFDRLKLKIPTIGEVLSQYYVINILRTINIALKNGLSIVDAIELAIQTTNNIALKFELQKVLKKVVQGISLSTAMNDSELFPNLCCQMLSIGEESGQMEELIEITLEYYEWFLSDFIDRLSKLIEPIAIIFVAIFVIIFVFAIAIPMFDLSTGAMIE